MKTAELNGFLNQVLEPERFQDACANGLVLEGTPVVRRLALGVSLNSDWISKALDWGADTMLVHHGVFQGGPFRLTGALYLLLRPLLERKINLFSYHLPLDAHPELGHNAVWARTLGLHPITPFEVGFMAQNPRHSSWSELLARHIPQPAPPCVPNAGPCGLQRQGPCWWLSAGPDIPRNIVLLSGSGAYALHKAHACGAYTLITGDLREHSPGEASLLGMNLLAWGHHRSERPGMEALSRHLSEHCGLTCSFLDVPSEL